MSVNDLLSEVLVCIVAEEDAEIVARALTGDDDDPMDYFTQGGRKALPGGRGTGRANRAHARKFDLNAATPAERVLRPVHIAP